MLQSLDLCQPLQARLRPPPAHRHLEESNAGGREVLAQQTFTLRLAEFGKAQFQVASRDVAPGTGESEHQRAEPTAQLQQERIRQLHQQPEQAKPQPQRPEARMQEVRTKLRTVHE